jgi:maleate isomerase
MTKKQRTAGAGRSARLRAEGRKSGIQIGLIAIAGDEAITAELRQILAPRRVKLYVAHVPSQVEGAAGATTGDIVNAAKWLALGQPISTIAYAGTLATIAMGEERIGRTLSEARPATAWTTPVTAALAGLRQLGARRVALLSPYSPASHRILAAYIRGRGIEIVEDAYLDVGEDGSPAVLSEAVLRSRLLDLRWAEAQAILICGTSLRMGGLIEKLEASTGLPVVAAGQALAWHCVRLSGDIEPLPGFGRLLNAAAPSMAG